MKHFLRELSDRASDDRRRRWLYVPYDQLSDRIGPLSSEEPGELGVVLVESPWKASRRPYHKQKLALVVGNQRRFALEQAERGVAIRYLVADGPYSSALAEVAGELGPLRVMRPAERELRVDLASLVEGGALEELPHEGWLTGRSTFDASRGRDGGWRMDAFYRRVRRESGVLMDGDEPVGGRFSFDADNRRPWKGDPPAPTPPSFPSDPIKDEVLELVASRYGDHPGRLDGDALPTTAGDAARLWEWARSSCLESFGPFEDAMSHRSPNLFHTRISSLLNLHRLLPRDVVADVEALDVPLSSREGFIRQVLGWREFVRHVHEATDGFRSTPGAADATTPHLGGDHPLPPVFWEEAPSGLRCLDEVVTSVWREGYSHHITRLMVIGNLATLLDLSARELTDWFWVAYTDAYDWVVEPNVLGMATFSLGPLFTTKPYVSGASYIDRMSDYCGGCVFSPRKTCPITRLYWAFLARHRETLAGNARMALPLRSLEKRDPAKRREDKATFDVVREALDRGDPVPGSETLDLG